MKTFVQFANENKLTQVQLELCFNAWNTACDFKNIQLAKKDEIIKELKIYSDFLSQYSDCDDSCSWARHSSRCRSVTKRILDHKNKIEELENGK